MIIHDSHAEILALRAFNRWLVDECKVVLGCGLPDRNHDVNGDDGGAKTGDTGYSSPSPSPFLHYRWRPNHHLNCPPFVLNPSVNIYMYATCAPCGDASMQFTMSEQADPTPWICDPAPAELDTITLTSPLTADPPPPQQQQLPGRSYFSHLAVTRRKPSRPDAAPTLSKSCSDKLALKQLTSVLSTPVAAWLVQPTPAAYLAALVMPSEEVRGCEGGCERAFAERLRGLEYWRAGEMGLYKFAIRGVASDLVESLWKFGKPRARPIFDSASHAGKVREESVLRAGNVSALWIVGHSNLENSRISQGEIKEVLINGVKQGFRFDSTNQKKASSVSRRGLWTALRDAIAELQTVFCNQDDGNVMKDVISAATYASVKQSASSSEPGKDRLEATRQGHEVLGNWIENRGDDEWGE